MAKECRDCKKCEEHIYWNHHDVRFIRKISVDSLRQLSIPRKFIKHFRGKLSETVSLKGPSGHIWDVKLIRTGDEMSLRHGWREFVEDHSLADDDVMVFTYGGDSHFNVLIFDRSGCEKAGSYLIRKCENQFKSGCQAKGKARKDFAGPSHATPQTSHDCTSPEELESDYETKQHPPTYAQKSQPHGQAGKETEDVLSGKGKRKAVNGGFSPNTVGQNCEHKSSKTRRVHVKQQQETKLPDGSLSYPLYFISSRRPVTEEERERAWAKALKFESANPHFIVLMQLTHVCRRFSIVVPVNFVRHHHLNKSQMVSLMTPSGKSWSVLYEYRVSKESSALVGGWQDFVFDNNLEEGDACVFELSSARKQIVFLVHIFRIVQEVVPLSRYVTKTSAKKK